MDALQAGEEMVPESSVTREVSFSVSATWGSSRLLRTLFGLNLALDRTDSDAGLPRRSQARRRLLGRHSVQPHRLHEADRDEAVVNAAPSVRARRFKARGRNYTWTTGFTVPIEVRVA